MNKGQRDEETLVTTLVKINTPVHWSTQASEMERPEQLAGGTVRTVST